MLPTELGCAYERNADATALSTYQQESGASTRRPEDACHEARSSSMVNGNEFQRATATW